MNLEALHLTDPTFKKEEVSFGGGAAEYYTKVLDLENLISPYYLTAMCSENGKVITGELYRRVGEALNQGLRGKEALSYLRTHALNPHPSEGQVKALKERVEYRIKPGSEKG